MIKQPRITSPISKTLNVYAPEVKLAMKKRGLVPVAESRAKSRLRELDAQYQELLARQDKIDAPAQGKIMKAIFKTRVLDFGQIPWHQKPKSLFKERNK